MTSSESRALLFVAALVGVSAVARAHEGKGAPTLTDAPEVVPAELREASEAALRREQARTRPLGPGERVDVNRAPAAELDRLPRVSRALADAIVTERESGGPFRQPADLSRVPGIGAATVKRLAPHVSFGGVLAGGPAGWPAGGLPRAGTAPARAPTAGRAGADAGQELIDVNRAAAAELESLPGIGPKLAARIVSYRDSAGPFRSVDELARVSGIGPATLARIRPRLKGIP